MKPGDLVKLVLPDDSIDSIRLGSRVMVSWPRGEGERSAYTNFPEGTVAVFLSMSNEAGLPALVDRILIEGRVGWVRSVYLEVV